ncbi:MAG TPA: mycothiol system anti-sigma-R factor [Acidimicrobiales bacterium]|nr:mycothiol system anti-sigma-R factor [Acidimicrobiales bacterium]
MSDEVADPFGAAPGYADCEEAVRTLYEYLDGELTEERRLAIQRHLDHCGPCIEAFGFEVELRRMLASRCRDHPPAELRERIARALGEEHD